LTTDRRGAILLAHTDQCAPTMNRHEFADLFSLQMATLEAGRTRFFERSVESKSFKSHLDAVQLDPLPGPSLGPHEVPASSLVGRVDPGYLVYRWQGSSFPTIIYHHGNLERPFEMSGNAKNTFRTVLAVGTREIEANLLVVRAPFHRMAVREYLQRMGRIENFVAMLAVSTALVEQIVRECREGGCRQILVAGISLGGTVTNLHRTHFSSADAYVPMLAGTAQGDMFTQSAYRRLLGKAGRRNPEIVQELLNFTHEYLRVRDHNVFPLLARYDRYVPFERQEECYSDHPVRVMERGHITAALSPKLLRRHIVDVLKGETPGHGL